MSTYRPIEPASNITFRSPLTGLRYLSLSLVQVKRLLAKGKFSAFTEWARARHNAARRCVECEHFFDDCTGDTCQTCADWLVTS